ncbi:MAG: hypothetical protein R3E53_05315 [Myxococcota bacterium]
MVDAAGEGVRVEGRRRDHREHVPVARIEGDERAHPALEVGLRGVLDHEGVLGGLLQVEVEGEHEAPTGRGLDAIELLDLPTRDVDDHVHAACATAEMALLRSLDPGLADDLTGSVALEARLLELPGRDLADRPEHLRGERAEHVLAQRLLLELDARQRVAMGSDLRARLETEVLRERDGLEARAVPGLADRARELAWIPLEDRTQHGVGAPGIADVVRHDADAVGGAAGRDRAALAIDDGPTLGLELHLTHRVDPGPAEQGLALEDLELEETTNEESEDREDQQHHGPEPDLPGTVARVGEARVAERIVHPRPRRGP